MTEPDSQPAPPAAASSAAPSLAAASSAAPSLAAASSWEPPPTLSDKFSHYSRKLIRFVVVALAVVVLITAFLWAVPAYQVVNSDAYALAVAKIKKHRGVRSFLGAPVECEQIPIRYTLTDDGGRLAFVVNGTYGRGLVDVEVRAGKVIRVRPNCTVDWTRPLSAQLPPIRSS